MGVPSVGDVRRAAKLKMLSILENRYDATMLYAVIVRAPDDALPNLEERAACYAHESDWDWEFASSDEVMFRFANQKAAIVFRTMCRLRGFSCKSA